MDNNNYIQTKIEIKVSAITISFLHKYHMEVKALYIRLLNNHRFESNACLILKPGGGGGVVYKLQWGVAVTIAGSIDDQSKSKVNIYNILLSYIKLLLIRSNNIYYWYLLCEDDWRNCCCNAKGLFCGNLLLVLPAYKIIM